MMGVKVIAPLLGLVNCRVTETELPGLIAPGAAVMYGFPLCVPVALERDTPGVSAESSNCTGPLIATPPVLAIVAVVIHFCETRLYTKPVKVTRTCAETS